MERWSHADSERFGRHAGLSAIAARLSVAQDELAAIQRHVDWLNALHKYRTKQIQRGAWPSCDGSHPSCVHPVKEVN